jgi:hypothetical protein
MFCLCRGGRSVKTPHFILSTFVFNFTAFPKHTTKIWNSELLGFWTLSIVR